MNGRPKKVSIHRVPKDQSKGDLQLIMFCERTITIVVIAAAAVAMNTGICQWNWYRSQAVNWASDYSTMALKYTDMMSLVLALSWWKVELYHSHSKSLESDPLIVRVCAKFDTHKTLFIFTPTKFNTQNFVRYSILTSRSVDAAVIPKSAYFVWAGKSRTQNPIHTFWLFFKCKSHGNFIRLDPSTIIINIIQDVLCQLCGEKVFCANVFTENLLIKWYRVTHRAQTNITVMTNIFPHNDQREQARQQKSAAISFYSFSRQHEAFNDQPNVSLKSLLN